MWEYEGESDRTRLRGAYPQQEEIELTKLFLKILFGGELSLTFPAGILPLHKDSRRDTIIASMPDCDELSIKKLWAGPQHPKVARFMGTPLSGDAGGVSSSSTAGEGTSTRGARTSTRHPRRHGRLCGRLCCRLCGL